MARIADFYGHLINTLRVLSGVVIFGVFVLIVADVLVRLVGIPPWTYTSGVVEYGLLWFTMLAAPWLVRVKGHVFIDALIRLVPAAAQRALARLAYAICTVSSAAFAYLSLRLLIDAIAQNLIDTRGEDMPMWTLLAPLPVGFALVAVEFGRYLLGFDSLYGSRTDVRDNV